MADATPEPRAELQQRARHMLALLGLRDEYADRMVAAALAAVEREAEAALARKVREILESLQVVPSRLEAEERADREYRNAVLLGDVPNLEQRTRRAVLAILKLLDPKEPGDAET